MSSKPKVTFVVHQSLQNELRERIVEDGYGLRGKSKWVSESINNLLASDNFPELVNLSDEMSGFEKVETVVIDFALKEALEQAIIRIRKEYPLLEGVKSRILRTAILQRLLGRK